MRSRLFAALIALASATAVFAQTARRRRRSISARAPRSPGTWTYQAVAGGSEARFVDSTGTARLVAAMHAGDAAGEHFA